MIDVVHAQRRVGPARLLPMLLVGNGIVGGMEEYVLSLLRRFRALGQRALVAAPFVGEFTAALLEQGHPARDLHILSMSDEINVTALAQLALYLKARRVTLVHTHLQPADTLGAAAAAQVGLPALSTLHGLHFAREHLLLRDLYGLRYVAVSETGRHTAIARGLDPDEVSTIPNGVDAERFDPARVDRDAARVRLGLAHDDILVTCVSRLAWEKYPEGFLKAAEIAYASDARLVFALVGVGPLESKLRQLAAVGGATGRILFLGARRDIPEILRATDVAALSSRTESLPFSVLEAMAMEVPVIAHDVGGVGEALQDGREGFLVRFNHSRRFAHRILELAADRSLRLRMGRAARQRILAHFDFRRSVDILLARYAQLMAEHARPAERRPGRERTAANGNGIAARPHAVVGALAGGAAGPVASVPGVLSPKVLPIDGKRVMGKRRPAEAVPATPRTASAGARSVVIAAGAAVASTRDETTSTQVF